MSRYLEDAAALLHKAADANERSEFRSGIHDRRIELAKEFAMLAAIDKGLAPAEYADRIRAAHTDQNGSIR